MAGTGHPHSGYLGCTGLVTAIGLDRQACIVVFDEKEEKMWIGRDGGIFVLLCCGAAVKTRLVLSESVFDEDVRCSVFAVSCLMKSASLTQSLSRAQSGAAVIAAGQLDSCQKRQKVDEIIDLAISPESAGQGNVLQNHRLSAFIQ